MVCYALLVSTLEYLDVSDFELSLSGRHQGC